MADTLADATSYEEFIRKSRFLVWAAPVQTPAQALDFIAAHADAQATHNCWAYRIGQSYRFNDDGEPAGTAGRPILQAIEGQGMDEVVVMVTRWFGGIKLGAGGLVRAYGGTAANCLRLAPRQVIIPTTLIRCQCAYADKARLDARLPEFGVQIESEAFDAEGVQWQWRVPVEHVATLRDLVRDITRGRGGWDEPDDAS